MLEACAEYSFLQKLSSENLRKCTFNLSIAEGGSRRAGRGPFELYNSFPCFSIHFVNIAPKISIASVDLCS